RSACGGVRIVLELVRSRRNQQRLFRVLEVLFDLRNQRLRGLHLTLVSGFTLGEADEVLVRLQRLGVLLVLLVSTRQIVIGREHVAVGSYGLFVRADRRAEFLLIGQEIAEVVMCVGKPGIDTDCRLVLLLGFRE